MRQRIPGRFNLAPRRGVPDAFSRPWTRAEIRKLNGARGFINAKDFGAIGGGTIDDTAALQRAIDNLPLGMTLLWTDIFLVIGSGSQCLLATKPINILGVGYGSGLLAGGAVPNTRDILSIIPAANSSAGYSFANFAIQNSSSARHALRIDGTGKDLVYNIRVKGMLITATLGGNSIFGTGATSGVFAYSSINENNVESIKIDSAGDGIEIRDNVISNVGSNTGINITQVVGAGGLNIKDNVIAGPAGMITIERGYPVIDGNELEQFVNNTQANGAMIDLNGGTGAGVTAAHIVNNTLSVNTGITGVTAALRLDKAIDSTIAGNRISVRGSNPHIVTTANAADVAIEESNIYYTDDAKVALKLTDAGLRTGITSAEHLLTLAANQTGQNVNTSQLWFPGGGATQITVLANTAYWFEGYLALARTAGTTSHITTLEFGGGTATISSIAFTAFGSQTTDGFFSPVAPLMKPGALASGETPWTSNNTANENLSTYVRGIVRFSGAGTFKPQFKYSAAPGGAPTIQANSWLRMKHIGPDTVLGRGFT